MTLGDGVTGRVALVTGASSGIGRATALRLADDGAMVVAVGRRTALVGEVAEQARGFAITADVTGEADAARAIAETVRRYGQLDILVNAAGILVPGDIESTSLAAWDETMNVNLRAAF